MQKHAQWFYLDYAQYLPTGGSELTQSTSLEEMSNKNFLDHVPLNGQQHIHLETNINIANYFLDMSVSYKNEHKHVPDI